MSWQLILLGALVAAIALVYFVIAPWYFNRDIPPYDPSDPYANADGDE